VPLVRLAVNVRALGRLDLPVPKTVGFALSTRLGPVGHYALFESFEEGTPAVDVVTDPAADAADRRRVVLAVADVLAELHGHRRSRHGWFLLPRSGPYVRAYLPRVHARVRRLAAAIAEIGRGDVLGRLESGLAAAAGALTTPPDYALLHGKVYANNFLVDDTEACMVDLGSVHYGDAARDVVRAEVRVCREDPELIAAFLERYLSRVEGLDAARLAVQRPFYAADLAITRAAGVLRDRRDGELEGEAFARALGAHLDRTLEALGA
jgi:aminoglycoside phosphotransferase (APT) family kinase protein